MEVQSPPGHNFHHFWDQLWKNLAYKSAISNRFRDIKRKQRCQLRPLSNTFFVTTKYNSTSSPQLQSTSKTRSQKTSKNISHYHGFLKIHGEGKFREIFDTNRSGGHWGTLDPLRPKWSTELLLGIIFLTLGTIFRRILLTKRPCRTIVAHI